MFCVINNPSCFLSSIPIPMSLPDHNIGWSSIITLFPLRLVISHYCFTCYEVIFASHTNITILGCYQFLYQIAFLVFGLQFSTSIYSTYFNASLVPFLEEVALQESGLEEGNLFKGPRFGRRNMGRVLRCLENQVQGELLLVSCHATRSTEVQVFK